MVRGCEAEFENDRVTKTTAPDSSGQYQPMRRTLGGINISSDEVKGRGFSTPRPFFCPYSL